MEQSALRPGGTGSLARLHGVPGPGCTEEGAVDEAREREGQAGGPSAAKWREYALESNQPELKLWCYRFL